MKSKVLGLILALSLIFSIALPVPSMAACQSKFLNSCNFTGGYLNSGYYVLTGDIDLEKTIIIGECKNVTIDVNGHVINAQNAIADDYPDWHCAIINNGKLNLIDSKHDESCSKHYFDYKTGAVWEYNKDALSGIGIGEITSETTDGAIIELKGGAITGANTSAIYNSETARGLNISDLNIVGNKGTDGGGGVYTFKNKNGFGANVYNTNFYGNEAPSGGAIYCCCDALIKDSMVKYNHATGKSVSENGVGGGIFCGTCVVTLIGTAVYKNTATTLGGGVYCSTSTCLIEGTKVTMADGSEKNIEDICDGDQVMTFNHESGQASTGKVMFVYEGEDTKRAFTLNFSDDISVGVVGAHCFLEKESKKYVNITEVNAQSYVGKQFYNAKSDKWEELISVTRDGSKYHYYSIYTAEQMNCVANCMLNVVDDVAYIVNTFDLDDSLKIDPDKKLADIEEYGLCTYEDYPSFSKEEFDNWCIKYLNIAVGKGLVTLEELSYRVGEIIGYDSEKTVKDAGNKSETFADSASNDNAEAKGCKPEDTFRTYAANAGDATLVIGSGTVVISNKSGETTDNVFLESNTFIKFIEESKGMAIGVSNPITCRFSAAMGVSDDYIPITVDGCENEAQYLKSDNADYFVSFVKPTENIESNHFVLGKQANEEDLAVSTEDTEWKPINLLSLLKKGLLFGLILKFLAIFKLC